MTRIELTRFRIKKGKEEKTQEWMDFHNSHHEDTVGTMAAENMFVETFFLKRLKTGICISIGILFKAKVVSL